MSWNACSGVMLTAFSYWEIALSYGPRRSSSAASALATLAPVAPVFLFASLRRQRGSVENHERLDAVVQELHLREAPLPPTWL